MKSDADNLSEYSFLRSGQEALYVRIFVSVKKILEPGAFQGAVLVRNS